MQAHERMFDPELLALARVTREAAEQMSDPAIRLRLIEIVDEILALAYLGDPSDLTKMKRAVTRLGMDLQQFPAA